jgi:hypothetical protein
MQSYYLKEYLLVLKLTSADLARLLDVSERTVQRWLSGDTEISGGPARAIEAWLALEAAGLPWRPDGVPLLHAQPGARAAIVLPTQPNQKTIEEIIENVYARGGPNMPWAIDLAQRQASLGHAWIKFKLLPNRLFVPQSYGRTDCAPDLVRDFPLIEDGYACIALAITKAEHLRVKQNWMEIAI